MSRVLPTRALAARVRPRTRAVLQNTDAECGLACLAMVLGHHGDRTTLRELRDRCTPGRDGVSAGALARLGRASGLDVKGYPADAAAIGQLPLPAIAHWSDDHFVVVDRVTKRRVHLVDPALGRRQLGHAEFAAQLGRVVLVAQPGPDFQRRTATTRPFWRTYVRELLRVPRTIRLLAQVLAVTVLTQALVLVMPLATRTVVDHLGALRGSDILPLLAAGIVAAGLAQLVTGLVRSSLLVYLQARLDTAAFLAFTAHLLRLPLQFFERRSTGDIMTRFASIAMLRDLMTTQTLSASLDAVLALGYLGALTVVFPALAGAVAAVIATIVLLLVFSANAVRERMAADLANQGRTQGFVVEALEGIATVKAAGVEARMVDETAHLVRDWMATSVRRTYLSAVIDSVTTALRSLAPLLVLWLCATRVVDGAMTTGTMLATTWLASAIVTPLASVVANGQGLQLAGAQLQRLADVFETPPEPPAAKSTEPLRGDIDVRSVSYRYDTYSPLVLEDVTLRVGPRQRLAVVGTTGSGKTTLGMLLLGLYPVSSGEIRVDGERLDVEAAQRLRRRIGVVLQEPYVFSGTIAENIALRDPTVAPDEVERAARLACLHDDVMAMPNGYGTRLAPRGAGLSGGQRQRLALARALVRRPAILLLDEATSHLDTATEASIYRNLAELDCVQIVIAHRLSTVRDADQIVVLERGRVVESGTHDTLLAAGGAYARLIAAQVVDARGPESASAWPVRHRPAPPQSNRPVRAGSASTAERR